MIDLAELERRARKRAWLESDGYWSRAAGFLRQCQTTRPQTQKARHWLHTLKQELREPWE